MIVQPFLYTEYITLYLLSQARTLSYIQGDYYYFFLFYEGRSRKYRYIRCSIRELLSYSAVEYVIRRIAIKLNTNNLAYDIITSVLFNPLYNEFSIIASL